jgi:hypothetical protein
MARGGFHAPQYFSYPGTWNAGVTDRTELKPDVVIVEKRERDRQLQHRQHAGRHQGERHGSLTLYLQRDKPAQQQERRSTACRQ